MAPGFNGETNSDRRDHGYQSLMSSLISPAPGTPMHGSFDWSSGQEWPMPIGAQSSSYAYGMPFAQGPSIQQPTLANDGQQGYMPSDANSGEGAHGKAGYEVDGYSPHSSLQHLVPAQHTEDNLGSLQQLKPQSGLNASQTRSQEASPQPQSKYGQSSSSKKAAGPTESDVQRLASLRAKLQAQKAERSGSAAPGQRRPITQDVQAPFKAEVDISTPQNDLGHQGVPSKNSQKAFDAQTIPSSNAEERNPLQPGHQRRQESGMSADIENLFAEIRNDAVEKTASSSVAAAEGPDGIPKETSLPILGKKSEALPAAVQHQETPKESISSSDEEGEIADEPAVEVPDTSPDEPMMTTENRQDPMTETQEKMGRQQETQKVYQPLANGIKNNSSGPIKTVSSNDVRPRTESQISPEHSRQVPAIPNPTNFSRTNGVLLREQTYRHHISHKPGQEIRRASETGIPKNLPRQEQDRARRISVAEDQTTCRQISTRDHLQDRGREMSDQQNQIRPHNEEPFSVKESRAVQATPAEGANPKRPLPYQRSQDVAMDDHENRGADRTQQWDLQASGTYKAQPHDAVYMADAEPEIALNDPELRDWLECTEFYDIEFRNRKLSRFRKMRALLAEKAELEKEDLIESEARAAARASSILSPPRSSSTRRTSIVNPAMAPPPKPVALQVITDNGAAGVYRGSPLTSTSTPTLKRQYAEADTEYRPAEKTARLDLNGNRTRQATPTSASGVKGERLSLRPEFASSALDSRMTRNDDFDRPPFRGRSRSPHYESYRPRSPMDRRRYLSYSPERTGPPNKARNFTARRSCFNCGDLDHHQNSCPYPRREGQDGKGNFAASRNYLGKKPLAVPAHHYDKNLANGRRASENGKTAYERGLANGRDYNDIRVSSLNRREDIEIAFN